MKVRLFSLFLLFAFTVPSVIYYFYLKIESNYIKDEVRSMINQELCEKSLVVLGFRRGEITSLLKWEHSKEFEFKGTMYDVVWNKLSGDSIFYCCYFDLKETFNKHKLNDYFKSFASESKQGSIIPSASQVLRILSLPVMSPFFTFAKIQFRKKFISNQPLFSLFYIIPPTPPPE